MESVIIIGAGSHSMEIDEYIRYSQKMACKNKLEVIGFLDDNPGYYSRHKFSAPLLGKIDEHSVKRGQSYIIGIADIRVRKLFVERFKARGARFLSLIHCTSYVSESAIIGTGTIIGPNVNIGPGVKIGNFNLLNSRCSIAHDTVIGNFNIISPNVCFSGFSKVGDENLFGINSASLPGLFVGNRNKIAAGMVLDQNVGDDSIVFYRFKERVISVLR